MSRMIHRLFITQILIGLFWIVFLLELFLSESLTPNIPVLIHMGAIVPNLSQDFQESYRFLAHIFLHGSFLHVIMNSIALYFSGRFLEMLIGRSWFFIIFLLSGYGGAEVALNFSDPHTILIGASGAVMGVLGALVYCALLLPQSPLRKELIRSSYQIIIPSLIPFFSGVSYEAHLGGLLVGFLLGFVVKMFSKISSKLMYLLGILGVVIGVIMLIVVGYKMMGF